MHLSEKIIVDFRFSTRRRFSTMRFLLLLFLMSGAMEGAAVTQAYSFVAGGQSTCLTF